MKDHLRQSLPGIRNIYMIPAALIPAYSMLTAICGGAIAMSRTGTSIPFVGEPTLTWESTAQNNGRCEKATLEFKSDVEISGGERLAFLVEGVSGKAYLLGKREPNYPLVEFSATTGTISEAAIISYKITLTDIKAVIPVIL